MSFCATPITRLEARMGELADRLAAMEVEATSPDGAITATVRGADTISMRFRPLAYRWYREDVLAHQLSQLAKLTWTRHHRYSKELVEHYLETPLLDDGIEFGAERRRYRERLEQLTAEGASDDGAIRVHTRAFLDWEFTLASGCLRQLTEDEFIVHVLSAVSALLTDHLGQIALLQDEIYGFGLPPSLRPWHMPTDDHRRSSAR